MGAWGMPPPSNSTLLSESNPAAASSSQVLHHATSFSSAKKHNYRHVFAHNPVTRWDLFFQSSAGVLRSLSLRRFFTGLFKGFSTATGSCNSETGAAEHPTRHDDASHGSCAGKDCDAPSTTPRAAKHGCGHIHGVLLPRPGATGLPLFLLGNHHPQGENFF